MDTLAFLDAVAKNKATPQPVYVLSGEEDFLRRLGREAVVQLALGEHDPSFALSYYSGEQPLDFSVVRNELETVAFLAPVRVAVVEAADAFITANREALEQYVRKPSQVGVLVLEAKTFPETTKLAKALPDASKLVCKAPTQQKLQEWCVQRARQYHKCKLESTAAEALVTLVGSGMGLLDQELAKLSLACASRGIIATADVEQLVGRSREANVFHILDQLGLARPAEALKILRQLFEQGEDPLAILGALTAQLRKLATIGQLVGQGMPLGPALDQAGIPKWPQARQSAERQLRVLGKSRLQQLNAWLVEINLGLKGGSPLPPRYQVERFLVKLAAPRPAATL